MRALGRTSTVLHYDVQIFEINVNSFKTDDVGVAQLAVVDDLSVDILVNLGAPLKNILCLLVGQIFSLTNSHTNIYTYAKFR